MKPENLRDKTDFLPALNTKDIPAGVDRRTFLMRSAVLSSAAVIAGYAVSEGEHTVAAAAPPQAAGTSISPDLDVVKKSKGPVMTTLDEFYKVGPGPSSSDTIGRMRITYNFYHRCLKLPLDQLAKANSPL